MLDIDRIIKVNNYVGIRAQDGMETLELTVKANHLAVVAAMVLLRLQDSDYA